jgi:hypothetical protein
MSVKVLPKDLRNLSWVLSEVDKKTDILAEDLLMQGGAFAVTSAAKATEPGNKSDPRKMAVKHRFRPIEKMVGISEFWYKKETESGKTYFFKSSKNIRIRKKKNKGLKKLKKGIKFWNKRKKKFDYMPTESKKKYDKSDKRTKIKYAGVAKLGWLKSFSNFKFNIDVKRRVSKLTKDFKGTNKGIRIDNLVEYVSKTSPQSVQVGLRAAAKRMMKIYKIKSDQMINRLNRR